MQDDAIDHQRRGDAEGHDVGEGIELAAEGAFIAAEPGEPAVERIEEARSEDEPDGAVKFVVSQIGGPGDDLGIRGDRRRVEDDGALDDLERRREPAEEVPRGHEIRQEVNLGAALSLIVGKLLIADCRLPIGNTPCKCMRRLCECA